MSAWDETRVPTIPPGDSNALIKAAARQIGFTAVGIAGVEALDSSRPSFDRWLAEGRHGQMHYLATFAERHARFRAQLPGLRSLIVVAASYAEENSCRPARGGPSRQLARPSGHGVPSDERGTSEAAASSEDPARWAGSSGAGRTTPSIGAAAGPNTLFTREVSAGRTTPSIGAAAGSNTLFTREVSAGRTTPSIGAAAGPNTLLAQGQALGRVARYAAGRDYHTVLLKRLKRLAEVLHASLPAPITTRCCVDTAPIHERSLAAAAGLGFIGKNTCLIQPKGGSWIVLGVIATDAELSPDAPITQTCGACTRCLDACPTGALTAPYAMDARRCIAYLTLEHRGDLPEPLHAPVGTWIAGCDICQEVCPYNAAPTPAVWPELRPGAGAGGQIPLADLLSLTTPQQFTDRYAGTALMRPRYEGLVRNALVAAGNSQDPRCLPLVRARTSDPNPVIRRAAIRAAEQLEAVSR